MKKSLIALSLIVWFAGCNTTEDGEPTGTDPENEVPFIEGTTIVFNSKDEASKLLGTSDRYTQELSKFDVISKTESKSNTTEQDYLDYAAQQALDWTDEEKASVRAQILGVRTKIEDKGLNLDFPEKINLVKSSMNEEGGFTSYTRENYIVIKGSVSEEYITHELFHILSRFNPDTRNELFKTINFVESNKIEYPEAIRDHIITNPDAPFLEHTLEVQIDGAQEEVVFILHSEEDWDGGSFTEYMKQKLMVVEGGPTNKTPTLIGNMPVLKNFEDASNLKSKIGNNTSYTLHPEEILAEHFVMLVMGKEVSAPSYIEAMKEVLLK
ncbi:MAG: hypothetical protein WD426_06450 [Anditalea sp.]